MRRLLLLLIIYLFFTPQTGFSEQQYDELRVNVIKFEMKHDPFVRTLYGCPLRGEISQQTCNRSLGILDYGLFLEARKRAAKLYHLQEPNE